MNSHQRRKARRKRERWYREFYSGPASPSITGRFSHSRPEIQRIPPPPASEEVRRLRELFFGRQEPGALIGVDYADLEMRIMAARRKT